MLSAYKQKIQQLELEPSTGGCFELHVDGDQIYSKLETGAFPDEDEIVQAIGKRV